MEHRIIRVRRQTPTKAKATGRLRCGAAAVDITPHLGLPMAGYSSSGKLASSVHGRLFARALLIEDARGERVALCHLDMMCASRYLLERSAALAAPVVGIDVGRLILTGTHTHTGPGLFYGNTLYDQFASPDVGFDQGLADWISRRVAEALKRAAEKLTPARIGVASVPLWGVSRNASLKAFLANPEASSWWDEGQPGHGAPEELHVTSRAVDPRLRVLAAVAEDGGVIGVSAAFGLHCTSLGGAFSGYHPDWAGIASDTAHQALREAGRGSPVVAVTPSAAGDANALRTDVAQGVALARLVGREVGARIAEATEAAITQAADDLTVDVRFSELDWTAAEPFKGAPEVRFAPEWSFGGATLAGGEDGRTWMYRYGLVSLGSRGDFFPQDHPQHPKQPAFGRFQGWIARRLGLEPSRVLPMHVLRLGEHVIATLPGEPTAIAAWRLERALLETTGARTACVLGYAGDYCGYLTTEEEFSVQHYEGASTLLGRHSAAYLARHLTAVASGAREATRPSGEALFSTGPQVERFVDRGIGPVAVADDIQATRAGQRARVTFQMERGAVLTFAEGPLVHLEEDTGTRWEPVSWRGRPLTDVTWPVTVSRRQGTFSDRWSVELELPDGLEVSGALRVRLARLGRFAGFMIKLPPG